MAEKKAKSTGEAKPSKPAKAAKAAEPKAAPAVEAKADKPKSMTKSQIFDEIAKATELSRKQVAAVFLELQKILKGQLSKKGPGVMALPGLVKIQRVVKPAVKAGGMRMNNFTKQMEPVKAKPARTIVRVRALKNLREMV